MSAEPSPVNVSGRQLPPPQPDEVSPFPGPAEAMPGKNDGNGDNAVKKAAPVWNKPPGDTALVSHVIGHEDSWPALSESTRHSSKSTCDSSPVSTSQGHLISNSKKNQNRNQNHYNTNQNQKSNANQTSTTSRQRSLNRGGGSLQNGFSHHLRPLPVPRPSPTPPPSTVPSPPPPPPFPPYPMYHGPYGPLPPPVPGPFFIGPPYSVNNWDRAAAGFVPQATPENDQPFQRNSYPRGNHGGRPRGDVQPNSSHGARRDHHRDRNSSRKGFARHSRSQAPQPPPPPPLPFFPVQSMRPFPDSMAFDMASPYVNFPATPPEFFMQFPLPLPLYAPPVDPTLPSVLIRQIDHYFSDNNLAKDIYLRENMDEEGWVDIAFIASFPMVQRMTNNLQLILDSLKDSSVVEVQGNRIRRRNNWKKWILSLPRSSSGSSSQTPGDYGESTLANSLKSITLEDENNSVDVEADCPSSGAHSDAANN